MNRHDVDRHFGIRGGDPFSRVWIESTDTKRAQHAVERAIEDHALLLLSGPPGAGKTESLKRALAQAGKSAAIVSPLATEKERLTIGAIENALVYDLSEEGPARSLEVRARQARRLLGEAAVGQEREVVLVLDDAHVLHPSTLRALKRLREWTWAGRSPLLTIVLVAHMDLMSRRGVADVWLRTDLSEMEGLSTAEARELLAAAVGRYFEADALDRLAEGAQPWPLELRKAAYAAMGVAARDGHRRVTAEDVVGAGVCGLGELLRRRGITVNAAARLAEVPKSTLHDVVSGRATASRRSEVEQKVLSALVREDVTKESGAVASA